MPQSGRSRHTQESSDPRPRPIRRDNAAASPAWFDSPDGDERTSSSCGRDFDRQHPIETRKEVTTSWASKADINDEAPAGSAELFLFARIGVLCSPIGGRRLSPSQAGEGPGRLRCEGLRGVAGQVGGRREQAKILRERLAPRRTLVVQGVGADTARDRTSLLHRPSRFPASLGAAVAEWRRRG